MKKIEQPKVFKNFEVYERLSKIILEKDVEKYNGKLAKVTKKETISLAKDYFAEQSHMNYILFNKLLEEGRVKFNKKNELGVYNPDKEYLTVSYRKTLEDLFNLISGLSKYVQQDKMNDIDVVPFRKVFPIAEQLRLYDNLEIENFMQTIHVTKNLLNKNIELAKFANRELELYCYLSSNRKKNVSPEVARYIFADRLYNHNIDYYGIQMVGFLLGTYINEMLNDKELSFDDYAYLKNNAGKESLQEKLGLNCFIAEDGFVIGDKDLDEIEKVYKKAIKRINGK